jgi:hypothetical protein
MSRVLIIDFSLYSILMQNYNWLDNAQWMPECSRDIPGCLLNFYTASKDFEQSTMNNFACLCSGS